MSPTPHYNITLIGTEGTGKTCFLAGLAVLGLNPANSTPLQIIPPDEKTKKYLNNLRDTLQNGSWVPPTNISTLLGFDLFLKRTKTTMRLQMLDYSGEGFRKAFNESTPESAQEFSEHIAKSEIALLLLDARDLLTINEKNYRHSLNEKLQSQLAAVWEKTGKETDLAVLVTKSDTIPELKKAAAKRDHGAAATRRFVKKYLGDFTETLRSAAKIQGIKFKKIPKIDNRKIIFYPVSAVGETDPATGRPVKNNVKPYGYETVFQWIAARQKRHAWRKVLFASVCVIVLLGIACFFWGSSIVATWEQERKFYDMINTPHLSVVEKLERINEFVIETERMRGCREQLIYEKLDELKERTGKASDNQMLEEIRSELVRLEELGAGGLENELRLRKEEVDHALVRYYSERVKVAFKSKPLDFERYAVDFLARYPNGPEAEEIKKMLDQAGLDKMKTAKSLLRDIAVRSPSQLQSKMERLGSFLREFENRLAPDERREMREAIDLAKKFLEGAEYTITVKRYGGFAYADYLKLNMMVGKTVHELHRSKEKVKDAHPGEVFSFRWKSGEEILMEIQAPGGTITYGNYTRAASDKSSDVDALALLNGKKTLTPAIPQNGSYWDWSLPSRKAPGGYYVICGIQNVSPEQWKAFEKYIKPGDAWKEER